MSERPSERVANEWPLLISAIRSCAKNFAGDGYKLLAMAVLDRAISDLYFGFDQKHCTDYIHDGARIAPYYRTAIAWINSNDSTYAFSYCNICNILQIDAQLIRRELTKLGWL